MTTAIANLIKRYRSAVDSGSKDIKFTTQEIADVVSELALSEIEHRKLLGEVKSSLQRIENKIEKSSGNLDGGSF